MEDRMNTEDSFKFSTAALQNETPAQQTSVRSIVVGGLVGFMLSAGSMYLSFKSGNSMSSSIFVAVIGFSMCVPCPALDWRALSESGIR
jgi:hypothetical protein